MRCDRNCVEKIENGSGVDPRRSKEKTNAVETMTPLKMRRRQIVIKSLAGSLVFELGVHYPVHLNLGHSLSVSIQQIVWLACFYVVSNCVSRHRLICETRPEYQDRSSAEPSPGGAVALREQVGSKTRWEAMAAVG